MALQNFNESFNEISGKGHEDVEANILVYKGLAFSRLKMYDSTMRCVDTGISHALRNNYLYIEERGLEIKQDILYETIDYEAYAEVSRQFKNIRDSLEKAENVERLQQLEFDRQFAVAMGDALNAFIDSPEMLMQGKIHVSFKARIRSGQQNMTVVGLCRNTTDPQPYDMAGFYMTSEWTQYDFDLNMPVADTVFIQINGFTTWYLDDMVITMDVDGVSEDTESAVAVYPNPADNRLHLDGVADEVTAYDMKGAQVLRLFNTNEVDTSALPNGIYLFSIRMAEGMTTKQIIINH